MNAKISVLIIFVEAIMYFCNNICINMPLIVPAFYFERVLFLLTNIPILPIGPGETRFWGHLPGLSSIKKINWMKKNPGNQ